MTTTAKETCANCAQYMWRCKLSSDEAEPLNSPCGFFTRTVTQPPSTQPPTQPVLAMTELEREAIEIALRFLAHNLKRCDITTLYYLPINSGFACLPEQAQAIESALEKLASI